MSILSLLLAASGHDTEDDQSEDECNADQHPRDDGALAAAARVSTAVLEVAAISAWGSSTASTAGAHRQQHQQRCLTD